MQCMQQVRKLWERTSCGLIRKTDSATRLALDLLQQRTPKVMGLKYSSGLKCQAFWAFTAGHKLHLTEYVGTGIYGVESKAGLTICFHLSFVETTNSFEQYSYANTVHSQQ